MIGTILYLPISILVLIFGLRFLEKMVFDFKKKINDWIICNTGYSVLGYDDVVNKGCFFLKPSTRTCNTTNPFKNIFSDIMNSITKSFTEFNYINFVNSFFTICFFIFFIIYFQPFSVLYHWLFDKTELKELKELTED